MTWISYGITAIPPVVPLLGAAPYTPDAISDRGVLSRIVNHHPIAIQAAAKKLIGRSPQIQAEAPIVEFAEALDNKIPLGVEVAGPLLEGEEIAVPVVSLPQTCFRIAAISPDSHPHTARKRCQLKEPHQRLA